MAVCVFQSRGLVEVMGYAGVDYVLIDAEHGSMGWTEIERMVLAAYASDTTPIVRVHENDEARIMRALDLGAMGVLVPHIRTAEEAQHVVDGAFYPPQGKRGVGPQSRYQVWSGIVGGLLCQHQQ